MSKSQEIDQGNDKMMTEQSKQFSWYYPLFITTAVLEGR